MTLVKLQTRQKLDLRLPAFAISVKLKNEKLKSEDEVLQQAMKEIREKLFKGVESLSEHDVDCCDKDSEQECSDHVGKLRDG